ncbi:MAG: hypothetical protein QXU93_11615 [Thermoproteus sp.]
MRVVLDGEPKDIVAETLKAALAELGDYRPALLEVDVYIRLEEGIHYATTLRYVLRRFGNKLCYVFKTRSFCSI